MATSIFKGIAEENACFQTSFGDSRCVLLSVPNEKNSVKVMPWRINEQRNGFVEFTEKGQVLTVHQVTALLQKLPILKESVMALKNNLLEGPIQWDLGESLMVSLDPKYPCVNIRKTWFNPYTGASGYRKQGLTLRLKSEFEDFVKAVEQAFPYLDL